ncbi:MAG: DUF554 domain-containing protein [Clostridia bacterium]|nr:DUF554 domain-containing protein [Clostridia bacterium]
MDFIFSHFLGTTVNFVAVLIAGILGTLLKRGIPKRFSDIIMSAMAICVIYIGIDGVLAPAPEVAEGSFLNAGLFKVLLMIVSMAVGTVLGELIDLDKQLNRLANSLGRGFKRISSALSRKKAAGAAASSDALSTEQTVGREDNCGSGEGGVDVAARFSEGFVSCSLLFCVGAMAINGAILDAQGQPGILLAKTVIDSIVCFIMAGTLGIGCAFSAFAVLIYQGAFNIVGLVLTELVSAATISYMSAVGSLIIILIGTNVLGMTKVKTANMVPAMFIAIGVEALFRLVFGA